MPAIIYLITNKVNGNRYVGFTTKTPHKRLIEHISASGCVKTKAYNTALSRAIRKYGKDAFKIECLYQAGPNESDEYVLNHHESYYILLLNPEYNLTCGGEGVLGYRHTTETRKLISDTQRGRKWSEERKLRHKNATKHNRPPVHAHEMAKLVFGHKVIIDDISFVSKNEAARYLTQKYGISRNTALRRIESGSIDYTIKKPWDIRFEKS